jgi:hypothetical protein
MLYKIEFYLAAMLYKIIHSFSQREMTSAHGDYFFPLEVHESKM